ncbi:hypothetical protein D3C76_1312960 [compost metagenome]
MSHTYVFQVASEPAVQAISVPGLHAHGVSEYQFEMHQARGVVVPLRDLKSNRWEVASEFPVLLQIL